MIGGGKHMSSDSHISNQPVSRNVSVYRKIGYLNSSILFWTLNTLFYVYRGLNFFQIAALQSIGSVISAILEVPTGWLSDRYGHTVILKISSLSKVFAVLFMIIAHNFWIFLLSEFCFSLGEAAQSGADSALLYESLKADGKEETYADVISAVSRRQSLIRMTVRLAAPFLYAVKPEIPFIISAVIYIGIAFLTCHYVPLPLQTGSPEKEEEHQSEDILHLICRKAASLVSNKAFIIYSLFSSFLMVSVSNYCQYIGPYLEGLGFSVGYLGIVTSSASIGEYVGIKFVDQIKRKCPAALLMAALSGMIALFIFGAGAVNSLPGGIIGYFVINALYAPFNILLGSELQRVIPSSRRATLLSVSCQIDDLFSVLGDPFIGMGIDSCGFGMIYQIVGAGTLFIIMAAFIAVNRISAARNGRDSADQKDL